MDIKSPTTTPTPGNSNGNNNSNSNGNSHNSNNNNNNNVSNNSNNVNNINSAVNAGNINVSVSSYHHHRAPRTPESYFNVPESIALLNIVKSERIQSAFQSNRKNHASVWEMVAEILNRFSARKRSAKQCCNRYENLKKIYTQLKKNPERHVRRNWPYMFLFKEIEEQRGECWGSANSKRLALIAKSHKELSYYQRRRQAAEIGGVSYLGGGAGVGKDAVAASAASAAAAAMVMQHHHSLLQSLSTDSSSNNSKMERFLPNHFVETQLGGDDGMGGGAGAGVCNTMLGIYEDKYDTGEGPLHLPPGASAAAVAAAAAAAMNAAAMQKEQEMRESGVGAVRGNGVDVGGGTRRDGDGGSANNGSRMIENSNEGGGGLNGALPLNGGAVGGGGDALPMSNGIGSGTSAANSAANFGSPVMGNLMVPPHHHMANGLIKDVLRSHFEKDCNSAMEPNGMGIPNGEHNISMKSEPMSEGEFNPDDIQLIQTNYNGSQSYYPHNIEPNILHPDVIVDTDNISDCSSLNGGGGGVGGVNGFSMGMGGSGRNKRKFSTTSTDDGDSTNYELIEYLKKREKRDEELLRRMDAREERLLALLERTVIAIETLAAAAGGGKKPVTIAEEESSK